MEDKITMAVKIITCTLLVLTTMLSLWNLYVENRERKARKRLKRQRLYIYAQLAEAFVEWGGLVPRSTGEFDLKYGGVWHSFAADNLGVAEPRLETVAAGNELRKRIAVATAGADQKARAAEYQEQLDDLRRLALVHTCDGVVGPIPRGWTRHLLALDRKGEPVFPKIEVLPYGNAGECCGGHRREDAQIVEGKDAHGTHSTTSAGGNQANPV